MSEAEAKQDVKELAEVRSLFSDVDYVTCLRFMVFSDRLRVCWYFPSQ